MNLQPSYTRSTSEADRARRIESEQRSQERYDQTKKPLEAGCGPLSEQMVLTKECGCGSPSRNFWAKHLLDEAAQEVQLEADSRWQHQSPDKEELELSSMGNDLRLKGCFMRQAFKAGNAGDWSECLSNDELSAWSNVKLRECYSEVEQAYEDRKSIAQLLVLKSTDIPGRIIVQVEGWGRVTLSYVCPHCHRYIRAR